jgi:hypothetical protein
VAVGVARWSVESAQSAQDKTEAGFQSATDHHHVCRAAEKSDRNTSGDAKLNVCRRATISSFGINAARSLTSWHPPAATDEGGAICPGGLWQQTHGRPSCESPYRE